MSDQDDSSDANRHKENYNGEQEDDYEVWRERILKNAYEALGKTYKQS